MPLRPKITLAYAQSLDGSIATRRGESLAISGPESLRMTHQLRALHDAILVGIGTIVADDPQLTVRFVEGDNPRPVILDSHLRFPLNARVMGNPHKPWIITTQNVSEDRRKVLESQGIKIIVVPTNSNGQVDLPAMLNTLSDSGIKSLMVEGGAQVITAFLRERLVDEVVVTIAPFFVGGLRAVETLLNGDAWSGNGNFPRLDSVRIESHGPDWVLRGKLIQ